MTSPAHTEDEFRRLVEPHRAELHAHCYRMLGSVHDAEDALQEALLRAWRGLGRFEGRSSLRSWLYRIATNTSLDLIARRPKRVLPADLGPPSEAPEDRPLVEGIWIEAYPDERFGVEEGYAAPEARYERRESVELAFIAAVQHLPAGQRAVLILRDVLGFSAREVATTLDATPAAIDTALQRAHKNVEERLPARSQQTTLRALGDRRLREIVDRFLAAWERADVDAVVGLLAEDALLTMPPIPTWFRGRDGIGAFLATRPLSGAVPTRLMATRANGQPAFGHYTWDAGRDAFVANDIVVLTMDGESIGEITAFLFTDATFERFGLPADIAATRA